MAGRSRSPITDPVLDAYRHQLKGAQPRAKAQFLIGLIQYLRRRYRSTSEFREEILRYTSQLEAHAALVQARELIPISRAISFSRRFVTGMSQKYGEELHKAPKGKDLRAIRRLKSPMCSDLIDPCFEFDFTELDEKGVAQNAS